MSGHATGIQQDDRAATVFLCGDVMTGRGIDHVLAHPADPQLREPHVKDAGEYVTLAEAANGPVPRPVRDAYVWGDALVELAHRQPRLRVANLETSVTTSSQFWPGKGIHYRMNPANVGCLSAAKLDICSLANNHVIDFGFSGLLETLAVLTQQGVRSAGAGTDLNAAQSPAVLPLLPGSRLLVFGCGTASSGIPESWGARRHRAGVDLLADLSRSTAMAFGERIRRGKGPRDVAMVSIHWGDNWGYEVPESHRRFAHWLIEGGADLIHGHSSHHPRPIEVYRDRLILYGCGDFLNDYEGISGYEHYRDDLVLMYFPTLIVDTGELVSLVMVPLQIRKLRLVRPSRSDAAWLLDRLARTSAHLGTRVEGNGEDAFSLVRQHVANARS
jgi:poly-gamma-glutamate synthesis protein (capsule biosynthesis protein)